MKPDLKTACEIAAKSGIEVNQVGDTTLLTKRTPTGKVSKQFQIFPRSWIQDNTVDLSISKLFRCSGAELLKLLGVKP